MSWKTERNLIIDEINSLRSVVVRLQRRVCRLEKPAVKKPRKRHKPQVTVEDLTVEDLERQLGGHGIKEIDGVRSVYYWDDCRGQGSGLDVAVRKATKADEALFKKLDRLQRYRRVQALRRAEKALVQYRRHARSHYPSRPF